MNRMPSSVLEELRKMPGNDVRRGDGDMSL